VVEAYFSQRRNSNAAQAFFEHALDETGVRPGQSHLMNEAPEGGSHHPRRPGNAWC
jgi:hypothetical protein